MNNKNQINLLHLKIFFICFFASFNINNARLLSNGRVIHKDDNLLFYYFIILLFYYFIILLFYYFIILLFYYFIILLFYYFIILLFYYFIILLFYYFIILLFYNNRFN